MIEHVLELTDLVLVMSVNPGFGGQAFIPSAVEKVAEIDRLRREKGYDFLIEVDGGINHDTAKEVIAAGADALVAGNYVFKERPLDKPIAKLREVFTS